MAAKHMVIASHWKTGLYQPLYTFSAPHLRTVVDAYEHRVFEIYDLSQPLEEQLCSKRAWVTLKG